MPTLSQPGPFRGLIPYDEGSAALFLGRAAEVASLHHLVTRDNSRVALLTGEAGVGKTSLVRAGLIPLLSRAGVLALHVGNHAAPDQDLWLSAGRAHADPPAAGEGFADYLSRLARGSRAGTLLVVDHLESVLAPGREADRDRLAGILAAAVAAFAGQRLRFLFVVDGDACQLLDPFLVASGLAPVPGASMNLSRMEQSAATEVIEQTALQTGTFLEAGLAGLIAGDLCKFGPCSPLNLQIVARQVLELRLTSLRRYEKSGGADALLPLFVERVLAQSEARSAGLVLLALVEVGIASLRQIAARTQLRRELVEPALDVCVHSGLVAKEEKDREARFSLVHAALAAHILVAVAPERARIESARRALRRAMLAGTRLSLRQALRATRYLGGTLGAPEKEHVSRSLRVGAIALGLGLLFAVGLCTAGVFHLRTSYTLDLGPAPGATSARVVVRLGKPTLGWFSFVPHNPRFGSVLADTGFVAGSLAPDVSRRIAAGRASGALERDRNTALPGWMRAVVDGLRPVPRGVALILLGDAGGVISLKQAFADPTTRREVLEVLAVIGAGRAGEDEILASALTDPSADTRLRGVEVAAAIDRRTGLASHGTTLRTALGDRSVDVKNAVLRECATLSATEAAAVLAVALADRDPGLRKQAERAVLTLAERSPAVAATAALPMLRSLDASARQAGTLLLGRVVARAPAETASTLLDLAADEKAPEEARVGAFGLLRRSGALPEAAARVLDQVITGEVSPRLREAALPLRARLLPPDEALALALGKGPPTSRAAVAAIWGAVALKQPDRAAKVLKGFLYEPSPAARVEAVRAFAALRRDGVALVGKALLDGDQEVVEAALASAVDLARTQPSLVAEVLVRAFKTIRPAYRQEVALAMERIAQDRASAMFGPLALALRQGDVPSRKVAVRAFCSIARKEASVVMYLRVASRDKQRDVRYAAEACLGDLQQAAAARNVRGSAHGPTVAQTEAAPRSATVPELVVALASSSEGERAAAAQALGAIEERHQAAAASVLETALTDPAHDVRKAAVAGLGRLWARQRSAQDLGRVLVTSESDSTRRLVAVEALVIQSADPGRGAAAAAQLDTIGETGPAGARLLAAVGRAFRGARLAAMHAFVERLLGG